MNTEEKVRFLKDQYSLQLLNEQGVVGVGVEKEKSGEFVLAIHLNSNDPKILDKLPKEIDGCPTKFIVTGVYKKF